jgi:hypothetical protein
MIAPRATFCGGEAVVMTTRPNAKRRQTPITDDEMLRLVEGILANPKPIEDSGYFWSELFEVLPQLSNENFFAVVDSEVITPTGERVAGDRQIFGRKNFLRWLEDMTRPSQAQKQPSRNEKNFLRWLAVFEARCATLKQKPKGSWNDAYRVASKRLANTPARGTPRTMKASYAKIQRTRRRAVQVPFF